MSEETVEKTQEELEMEVELEAERRAALTDEERDAEDAAAALLGQPTSAAIKRPKKLLKDLSEAGIVKITVLGGTKGEMQFPVSALPEEIRTNLVPFGLGHKLGDAAAGQAGVDAETAINKVWDGLVKGDWTVRAPAAPKVSLAEIANNLKGMSEAEQAQAKALLAQMGITLPGM
jgi:hypothetical protein